MFVRKPKVKATIRGKMSNDVSAVVQKCTEANIFKPCRKLSLIRSKVLHKTLASTSSRSNFAVEGPVVSLQLLQNSVSKLN